MDANTDSLGRRNRLNPQSTGKRVTPQGRDMLWFSKLAEHGPLPSSFLLAYASDTHRSAKRARERLTDLFNEDTTPDGGPYFMRPPQQFRTLDSRYNQLVYDLAPAGRRALAQTDKVICRRAAPSGPWLHRFMTGCITASIELATLARPNIVYIPQSAILERAGTDMRFTVAIADPKANLHLVKDIIPDAVFGIKYESDEGDRFRFFAVEADRATEPATTSNWNRKSFLRNLLQYEAYVAGGEYREHLKLTAPLLVLTVSSDASRIARMTDLVARRHPAGNSFMLFQAWQDFGPVFRPPEPKPALLMGGWVRGGLAPFYIDRP